MQYSFIAIQLLQTRNFESLVLKFRKINLPKRCTFESIQFQEFHDSLKSLERAKIIKFPNIE